MKLNGFRNAGTTSGINLLVWFLPVLSLFFIVRAAAETPSAPDPDALATLVVYNSNDSLSEDLARFYAEKRSIPSDQVVGIPCSRSEEITRDQYDEEIAEPLRQIFNERGWWKLAVEDGRSIAVQNKIRFIALIRGIPVKIMEALSYPGDKPEPSSPVGKHNEAAVDSELATLGFSSPQISGALNNPYFRRYSKIREANLPPLMLVTRLDAPTGAQVRRMIEDSIAAERSGIWGFTYLDTRNLTSGGLAEGDEWLQTIGKRMRESGVPVVQSHSNRMFPKDYPMRNAAFYYGWYSANASGPFADPDFKFNRGAVAVHIHSFSAKLIRDPKFGWVAPLLMRGAAATTGNVYEPYLALTPNLDILDDRLRAGFTFAEACYMSQKALSWMTTFVGDPLYRPFRFFQDLSAEPPAEAAEWWTLRQATRDYYSGNESGALQELREKGHSTKSGILFEGLASIYAAGGQLEDALQASQTARKYYANPQDVLRLAIREANLLAGMNRYSEAVELLEVTSGRYPGEPATHVLHKLRDELVKEGKLNKRG